MKVILSRKGFDSENGRVPSAIMPDARLIPFPIPASNDPSTYSQVVVNGLAIGGLVEDLTKGKISRANGCHLDPDLDEGSLPRIAGWRPSLGQIDAAQGHLAKQKVTSGDLFLFFGWFRHIEMTQDRWRYTPGSRDVHVLYGWLRVGHIVRLGDGERPHPIEAFSNHPHLHGRDRRSNTLHLASDRLAIGDLDSPGAGLFRRVTANRVLTHPLQEKRTLWRLPAWMHPDNGTSLTYHLDRGRWRLENGACVTRSASKGQEFVLQARDLGGLQEWIDGIFKE